MKKVKFKWSDTIFEGVIIEQSSSLLLGQKTIVKTSSPLQQEFTMYGRFDIGNCGPFTIISID